VTPIWRIFLVVSQDSVNTSHTVLKRWVFKLSFAYCMEDDYHNQGHVISRDVRGTLEQERGSTF
jgi:hypothetical protein